jgi:hypothetical protein
MEPNRVLESLQLDETCRAIATILIKDNSYYSLHELVRNLRRKGLRVRGPELIKHIEHLLEKDLIIRERGGVVNKYRFNWNEFSEQLIDNERLSEAERSAEKELSNFNKLSVMEQINYTHDVMMLINLLKMRNLITGCLEPEKKYSDENLQKYEDLWNRITERLIKNCEKKGEKYTLQTRKNIDNLIDLYFEQRLSKPEKTDELM